jgi:hypothetical protein
VPAVANAMRKLIAVIATLAIARDANRYGINFLYNQ